MGSGLGADARVAARSCCVSWSSPERGCGIFPPGAPRTTTRRTRPGCTGSCSLGRREAGRPHNRSQKVVHLRVRAPPLFPTRTPPGRPSSRCVKVPGARIAGLLFWSLATRLSSAGSQEVGGSGRWRTRTHVPRTCYFAGTPGTTHGGYGSLWNTNRVCSRKRKTSPWWYCCSARTTPCCGPGGNTNTA